MLFGLGVLGIVCHNLLAIIKLKKAGKFYSYVKYLQAEIESILLSGFIVAAAVLCKQEVKSLDAAGAYLGLGFVAIGYMGQSIFITLMGRIQKNFNDDHKK